MHIQSTHGHGLKQATNEEKSNVLSHDSECNFRPDDVTVLIQSPWFCANF